MRRSMLRSSGLGLPVAALLLLSVAGLSARGVRECIEPVATVLVGETEEVTLEAPAWLELGSTYEHVYRAEVSGPAGSSLELWTTYFESGQSCYVVTDDLVAEEQMTGEPGVLEWTEWVGTAALKVSPAADVGSATYSVTLTELAAPPEPRGEVIPVVAHRAGVGGAFFTTDLWVLNPRDVQTQLALDFLPGAGGQKLSFETTLEPQRLLHLEDLVRSVFGLDDARGALTLASSRDLLTLSRTFTSADDGTFGQRVPAESWRRSAGAGQPGGERGGRRYLPFLAGPPSFRTNVGFVEVLGLDAEVELELFDQQGMPVASGSVVVPARSHLQVDDLFGFLGTPGLEGANLVVTVNSLGRVFTYASVVDNRTQDATYVPGLREVDAWNTQVIPAAASTDGAHGTHWRTDLRVLAVGPTTAVEVEFLPSDGSAPVTRTFPLSGSGVLALDDVVGNLGAHGSGALELAADEKILAVSRTYNRTPDGTFGQLIQAEGPWDGRVTAGVAVGVEGSGDYRTNVGMFNPSAETTLDVLVRLVSGEGVLLGSRGYTLGPRRHVQVNDVFAALRVAGQGDCRVDFVASGTNPYVYAYASVVDNRTGDPLYVPAIAVWNDLEPSVELDNRSNALLVDQLPAAVVLEPLPVGTLTATVSGSGDLGRPDLPIQVLCLYENPAGQLRSAVLPIGGAVTDVAGGGRLWCVIPDWMSTVDNSGAVTVALTGGDRDASLTLDARGNAVLLDEQEETLTWARPTAETIRVETTGDLGRPELEPQVVVMYREEGSQRLQVQAMADGEAFGPVATDFQLLVTVVDWVNRDDNTGTTRLLRACTTRPGACNRVVAGTLSDTDCELPPPFPTSHVGERIPFFGEAGRVVSVAARAESFWFKLFLRDPSGRTIAISEYTRGDGETEITGQVLPSSGSYELWAVEEPSYWRADAYTVAIDCQGP